MVVAELFASSLRMAVPILITAIGAVFTERSGIVNIGLEGMMIVGSFWASVGAYYYGPIMGLFSAMIAGAFLALIHSIITVTFRVNQVVSGVALNILAYGSSRFLCLLIFGKATTSHHVSGFTTVDIPGLSDIAFLKPLLADISPILIMALVMVPIAKYIIDKTVFGLRLRSVGENPLAADTLGINVFALRYASVVISGMLAGIAGAYLTMEHTGMYVEGMTQGKGYIAMAAMIFGNWTPTGTFGASLLFGFAEALSLRAGEGSIVPYQFIKMIPYVLTLAVLTGIVKKSTPPAASGVPYDRSSG